MNRKLSHVVKLVIGFASVGYLIVSVSTTALGAEFYKVRPFGLSWAFRRVVVLIYGRDW